MSRSITSVSIFILGLLVAAQTASASNGYALLHHISGRSIITEARRVDIVQLDSDAPLEVIVHYGQYLRIYDGGTGTLEFEYQTGTTDPTTGGCMLKDVTGDGQAELVYSNGTEGQQTLVFQIPGGFPTSAEHPGIGLEPAHLDQSRPNPFRDETEIEFSLARNDRASVTIYNVQGRVVRKLLSDELLPAGIHRLTWDGRNEGGERVASGQYFYQLTTDAGTDARKTLLLR